MIYLSYFVCVGTTLYTKKGVIAFLFAKSGVILENMGFVIKNVEVDLTLPENIRGIIR